MGCIDIVSKPSSAVRTGKERKTPFQVVAPGL